MFQHTQQHKSATLPIALALSCLLTACQTLPSLEGRSESTYLATPPSPTRLQNTIAPTPSAATLSNIYLLNDPHDAFVARAALIESADHTLDMAYYIWHNDVSGKLLLQMLQQAAQRGVRVRLLLDDNNTRGMDHLLAALNADPNIEIRLFNPFLNRKIRALGYLTDFPRLNRRMHNKSLTADNQATIVGGRNIGDEYFNISTDIGFVDLDILATGAVVSQVSQDFDRYWASQSSYPLERIITQANLAQGRAELQQANDTDAPIRASYHASLMTSPLHRAITENRIPWIPAHARLISDDPAKGLARSRSKPDIDVKLVQAMGIPQHSMYIVSPYFVPTQKGVEALSYVKQQGVDITVLTNSLRATDVVAVHSGYAKYRKDLLKAGIELYEVKPDFAPPKAKDKGLTGSSVASLHAKTFVVDSQRVFIGSFNLDPRSARLNTEMGVIIDSPQIARNMQQNLLQTTPQYAYKVTLNQRNKLQWQDPNQPEVIHKKEPDAGFWKRLSVKILSIFPIESLL